MATTKLYSGNHLPISKIEYNRKSTFLYVFQTHTRLAWRHTFKTIVYCVWLEMFRLGTGLHHFSSSFVRRCLYITLTRCSNIRNYTTIWTEDSLLISPHDGAPLVRAHLKLFKMTFNNFDSFYFNDVRNCLALT